MQSWTAKRAEPECRFRKGLKEQVMESYAGNEAWVRMLTYRKRKEDQEAGVPYVRGNIHII